MHVANVLVPCTYFVCHVKHVCEDSHCHNVALNVWMSICYCRGNSMKLYTKGSFAVINTHNSAYQAHDCNMLKQQCIHGPYQECENTHTLHLFLVFCSPTNHQIGHKGGGKKVESKLKVKQYAYYYKLHLRGNGTFVVSFIAFPYQC